MRSGTGDKFQWLATAPAVLACSLAAIYALGAVSIFGQFLAADLDAVQTMPLVPIDQILARGIGAIIDQAKLGLFAVSLAYMVSAVEDLVETRAAKPGGTASARQQQPGSGGMGRRLGIALPVAMLFGGFFLPFGLVTTLGAGLLAMQALIPRVRDALVERGHAKWRPAAFLIGYGGFLIVSAVVGAFTRATPLPEATLIRDSGSLIRGGLVAQNGSDWFIAEDGGRILNAPEGSVAGVTITYPDNVEDESLFQMLKD